MSAAAPTAAAPDLGPPPTPRWPSANPKIYCPRCGSRHLSVGDGKLTPRVGTPRCYMRAVLCRACGKAFKERSPIPADSPDFQRWWDEEGRAKAERRARISNARNAALRVRRSAAAAAQRHLEASAAASDVSLPQLERDRWSGRAAAASAQWTELQAAAVAAEADWDAAKDPE